MRDLLLPMALMPSLIATVPINIQEAESWWERAQKHGVGFVFFLLFIIITLASYYRERKAEEARVKREDSANSERLAMQTEIRDLNLKQLDSSKEHSKSLENLISESIRSQNEVGAEMKSLSRRIHCKGGDA